MTRLLNLTIVARLRIAYVLFLLPVAFLFAALYSATSRQIDVTRLEIAGVGYNRGLFELYDAVARGGQSGGQSGAAVAAIAEKAQHRFGAGMDTAGDQAALIALLRREPPASVADVAAMILAMVAKMTDASGLTLDTDLDSFYVMDAATGKIPGVIDGLRELGAMTKGFAANSNLSANDQAAFLLAEGRTRAALDGTKTSLETAFKANQSGKTSAALGQGLEAAHQRATAALAELNAMALTDRAKGANAPEVAAVAGGELARLRDAAAAELERLLADRIARLRGELWSTVGIAVFLFTLSVGFIALAVERGGVRPLTRMTTAMRGLADGDLDTVIPGTGRRDEIGQMAAAMAVFRENVLRARELDQAAAKAARMKDHRQAAMDRHVRDFGTATAGVMERLTTDAAAMGKQAADTAEVVRRTRELAAETAGGATESARNLTQVAAAAEQMSASTNEIGVQIARVTEAVRISVDRAEETDRKVAGLADAAEHVESIVRLITDIAGRTNLLALNATIESARAGEAGKGFAVVAGEVKALATQTAQATDEIAAQIANIRAATTGAVSAVRDVGAAIGEVTAVATAIAAAVEEQTQVTASIAESVKTVAATTRQATGTMRDVSAMSDSAEAATGAVLTASGHVRDSAGILHRELTQFLTAISALDQEERRLYG